MALENAMAVIDGKVVGTAIDQATNVLLSNDESVEDYLVKEQNNEGVKNKFAYPYTYTKTVDGITYSAAGNKKIAANGTATADSYYIISYVDLAPGKYIASGCPQGGSENTYRLICEKSSDGVNWTLIGYDYNEGIEFTLSTSQYVRLSILVTNGVTVSNVVFSPMIRDFDSFNDTYVEGALTNKALTNRVLGGKETTYYDQYLISAYQSWTYSYTQPQMTYITIGGPVVAVIYQKHTTAKSAGGIMFGYPLSRPWYFHITENNAGTVMVTDCYQL